MADQDLLNAFDDCINRLSAGQTVDDCLRAHPQYAPALRPMLEAGLTIRRIQVNPAEVNQAQARVRARVALAARAAPARTTYPLRSLAALAAALLVVFLVISGGAVTLAQSSLPGDPLYGIKRLTESVRLAVSGNDPALQTEFAARRIGEIEQILALGRAANMDFAGEIETINGDAWVVAGLPLRVPEKSLGTTEFRVGDRVEINAYTTASGALIAREIHLTEPSEREPLPTPTPIPTRSIATSTPPPTATPAPTNTPPSRTPTYTSTPTPSQTPTVTSTPSTTACVPFQPQGWEAYTVQAGDTLSALAAIRGITLDELMDANCLTNPRLIFAGQRLYLPPGPPPPRPPAQPTTAAPAQPTAPIEDINPPPGDDNPPPGNDNVPGDNTNDNHDDDDNDNDNDNDDDDD